MISGSRRDSVGGGSSRNILRSPEAVAIQWGGGSTVHFPLMGPFFIYYLFKRGAPFCIFGIFNRGDPLFHFWDFQKGGPGPPGPPPESATA